MIILMSPLLFYHHNDWEVTVSSGCPGGILAVPGEFLPKS